MSRWIRGRLGRPIAGIISILMLVTILLPMASPPAMAQFEDTSNTPTGMNIGSLLENLDSNETIPIAVLDFYNRSGYKSGGISQETADSLALALAGTGKYSVLERSQVDAVMRDTNFSVPLSFEAQAMIADRLNVPFVVSGEIERVALQRTKEGVYAEVVMNALVISKITRRPINGARVTTKSSPKLGYVTNNMDPLVQEAIFIGASMMTNRILDHQPPLATVLNPASDGLVRVRGGSVIGFRAGMQLVAVRQGSVSGILQIDSVTPIESLCRVVLNIRGVAPSDKVVPFYTNDADTSTPSSRLSKSMGSLLPWAAAGALALLVNQSKSAASAPSIKAAPMADAQPWGFSDGATIITWQKTNKQVLNYIIYRITNNDTRAIAVVSGNQNYYIDAGYMPVKTFGSTSGTTTGNLVVERRFASLRTFTLEIDPALSGPTGPQVLQQDYTEDTPTYWNYTYNLDDPTLSVEDTPPTFTTTLTISPTTITVPCLDVPMPPGSSAAYSVRPIYYTWEATTGDSASGVDYSLKFGEMSPITPMVTMTPVPIMFNLNGIDPLTSGVFSWVSPEYVFDPTAFQGGKVSGMLQLSGDPLFGAASTVLVFPASMMDLTLMDSVLSLENNVTALQITYNVLEKINSEPKLQNINPIYYRVGVKYPTNAAAVPRQANANSSYNGYVFSEFKSFDVNRSMLIRSFNNPRQVGPVSPLKSSRGHGTRLLK